MKLYVRVSDFKKLFLRSTNPFVAEEHFKSHRRYTSSRKYIFYEKACALQMFQSTHPHGVRQSQIEFYVELTKVSIHAPTRGATHPEFQKNVDDLVSIHAPTRGATVLSRSGIRPMVSFNPRTHTGCDLGNTHKRFGYCVSIHAPTRGATKPKTFRYFVPRGFNPRTHTGCD